MQSWEDFMATITLVQRQTAVMTDLVFKRWDHLILAALAVAILATLIYFLVVWFSRRDWMYYPLPFAIMTGGFLQV